ncbi:hypothetical protein DER46DRAFT_665315 [Fusarium sp. MPI-SDFR-AT-0072]|nr:hypothetical protein DER46DRAFT_665315 [Fusarium sp. MPI-SDFR-AT-0072]
MSEQESKNPSAFDKHLFLVFLRRAVRDVAAVEFIRHTFQCNSSTPWENVTGDLQYNIIEVTPRQAEQLASYPDIVRITPVEATGVEEDIQHEDDSTKEVYIVRPTNRRDKDQYRATHASLKAIFQDQMQPQDIGLYGVNLWKINLTDDQVPLVAKVKGFKSLVPLDEYRSRYAEIPGGGRIGLSSRWTLKMKISAKQQTLLSGFCLGTMRSRNRCKMGHSVSGGHHCLRGR